jgi:hypothetical protein
VIVRDLAEKDFSYPVSLFIPEIYPMAAQGMDEFEQQQIRLGHP